MTALRYLVKVHVNRQPARSLSPKAEHNEGRQEGIRRRLPTARPKDRRALPVNEVQDLIDRVVESPRVPAGFHSMCQSARLHTLFSEVEESRAHRDIGVMQRWDVGAI